MSHRRYLGNKLRDIDQAGLVLPETAIEAFTCFAKILAICHQSTFQETLIPGADENSLVYSIDCYIPESRSCLFYQ